MAINNDITFVIGSQIVAIGGGLTSVSNQDIFDSANNFLDEVQANQVKNFVFAGGLEALTIPGQFVGLSVTIVDWRVQFADRAGPGTEEVAVVGNLFGRVGSIGGAAQSPIEPSAFTFVRIVESTAPVFINGEAATFWDALLTDHVVPESLGDWVQNKLLSVTKFLSLK